MSRSHTQSGSSIVLFDQKLRSSADELERALTRRNEIVNRYKQDQASGMALTLSVQNAICLARPTYQFRPAEFQLDPISDV